jgi:hypothetical protein
MFLSTGLQEITLLATADNHNNINNGNTTTTTTTNKSGKRKDVTNFDIQLKYSFPSTSDNELVQMVDEIVADHNNNNNNNNSNELVLVNWRANKQEKINVGFEEFIRQLITSEALEVFKKKSPRLECIICRTEIDEFTATQSSNSNSNSKLSSILKENVSQPELHVTCAGGNHVVHRECFLDYAIHHTTGIGIPNIPLKCWEPKCTSLMNLDALTRITAIGANHGNRSQQAYNSVITGRFRKNIINNRTSSGGGAVIALQCPICFHSNNFTRTRTDGIDFRVTCNDCAVVFCSGCGLSDAEHTRMEDKVSIPFPIPTTAAWLRSASSQRREKQDYPCYQANVHTAVSPFLSFQVGFPEEKDLQSLNALCNWIAVTLDCQLPQCPYCQCRIEKHGACNHITCTKCQTQFCYVCSKIFTSNSGEYHRLLTNQPELLASYHQPSDNNSNSNSDSSSNTVQHPPRNHNGRYEYGLHFEDVEDGSRLFRHHDIANPRANFKQCPRYLRLYAEIGGNRALMNSIQDEDAKSLYNAYVTARRNSGGGDVEPALIPVFTESVRIRAFRIICQGRLTDKIAGDLEFESKAELIDAVKRYLKLPSTYSVASRQSKQSKSANVEISVMDDDNNNDQDLQLAIERSKMDNNNTNTSSASSTIANNNSNRISAITAFNMNLIRMDPPRLKRPRSVSRVISRASIDRIRGIPEESRKRVRQTNSVCTLVIDEETTLTVNYNSTDSIAHFLTRARSTFKAARFPQGKTDLSELFPRLFNLTTLPTNGSSIPI